MRASRGMGAIRPELKKPKGVVKRRRDNTDFTEYAEGGETRSRPQSPSLWSKVKAEAKAKFDVYPSAYANAWAAKEYKSRGGSWAGADNRVKRG